LDGVAEQWLEIRIERPLGAGTAVDADEAPVEPRQLTLHGIGARWAELT
jgi:hypothetical protein